MKTAWVLNGLSREQPSGMPEPRSIVKSPVEKRGAFPPAETAPILRQYQDGSWLQCCGRVWRVLPDTRAFCRKESSRGMDARMSTAGTWLTAAVVVSLYLIGSSSELL